MRFALREVVLLATLLALALPAHSEPVAVLAAVKGKVLLTAAHGRTKGPSPATFGAPLEREDRISVGSNGSATLCFNDGNVIELGAGSSLTISGRIAPGPVAGAEKLPREAFSALVNFRLIGSRAHGLVPAPALRSGGTSGAPEPLAPRNTDVLDARPALAWQASPGATRYVVTLSGMSGELWTHECETDSLTFPADAPALADGEYVWDVQAFDAGGPIGRASATFRLVPEVEAHAVRGVVDRMHESAGGVNAPAARYLAGAFLYERGFLADAGEEFTALARLAPESAAPHEALGDVYRAVGLPDMAAAAYRQAKLLSPGR